jgi:hypothetical protein
MKITTTIALAAAGCVLALAFPASAQTPPPNKRIFVDFNVGIQPSARTFTISAFPIVYGEAAVIRGTQGIDGAPFIDVTGGYRVWRNFSAALSLTTTMTGKGDASITGGIPHPIFFDTRVESTVAVTGLAHKERSAHVSFMWTSPVTDKIDASAFGGPSYVKVFQDVIDGITVPDGTQTFVPVAGVEQTATKLGFHVGGDVTFLFTPHIGAGGMVRFVKAKVDLPAATGLTAAGLQYGGGVRVRF